MSGAAGELPTGLPPLRWRADEDLVYDSATETLHRSGCQRLLSPDTARLLPSGAVLERMTAPRFCECRPDVTTTLSAPGLGADGGGGADAGGDAPPSGAGGPGTV